MSLAEKRILIVEDEALIAMQIEMDIEDAGAVVAKICVNLTEGLAAVNNSDFDGAILDVDLGGVDSFPIADKLQSLNIPFVFHTGHGEKVDLEERFPGTTVFTKPGDALRMLTKLFT